MIVTILTGSNHEGARSSKLGAHIASLIDAEGHDARLFDLHQRPVPLFSEKGGADDNENVVTLKQWVAEAKALVIVTPEYHGSLSGVLKNAIDYLWKEFDGTPVLSASIAGGAVGTSSLIHLQTIMRNVHAINSPEWISMGRGDDFDESGAPADERSAKRIAKACAYLLSMAGALAEF